MMTFKIQPEKRPSLGAALAIAMIVFLVLFSIFSGNIKSASQKTAKKTAELYQAKSLISRKDEIASAYQKLKSRDDVHSIGDWVKQLNELAKKEKVVFDSITPASSAEDDATDLNVTLGFRTDLAGFSGFVQSLTEEDYLCAIQTLNIDKMDDGLLECRISLKRSLL